MVHKDVWRNGQRLVSVTELQSIINKPFLEPWKISLCECPAHKNKNEKLCGFIHAKKVVEEASELGNLVHEEVERYLNAGDEYSQTVWTPKIIEQLKLVKAKPVLIRPEQSMIDEESGLAGSPDGVFEVDCPEYKGIVIGDNKIKNSLDSLTGMQGAGYRYLLKRKHGVDVNKMLIFWAQKKLVTPKVKLVWIDLDEWQEPFKHLVELWNVINPKRRVTLLG
jgi:hypothetical protein